MVEKEDGGSFPRSQHLKGGHVVLVLWD